MRTSAVVMQEIQAEVVAARAALDAVVQTGDGSGLAARMLRMDAGMLVQLVDELEVVRAREFQLMRASLHRAGDYTLDEEGQDDL